MADYNSKDNAAQLKQIVSARLSEVDLRDQREMYPDTLLVSALGTPVEYLASCVSQELKGINGANYPWTEEELSEAIDQECGITA